MKRNKLFYLASFIYVLGLSSCVDDPDIEKPVVKGKYETGYFITNEGPFSDGTGTISFVNEDGTVSNDVFQAENDGQVLGSILQSMTIIDDNAYFLMNNAQKVEVADRKELKSTGKIENLNQPRYMISVGNDRAYVSQWGATGSESKIAVLDLTNNTVESVIDLEQSGAENMAMSDGKVYVVNSGGYGRDSTLSIINTADGTFESIVISDNPVDVEVDKNGAVWVIAKGYNDWSNSENNTNGGLFRIENGAIVASFELPNGASHLEINKAGDKLFYIASGAVYAFGITDTEVSTTPLIQRSFYSLGVNKSNDHIFGSDANDYKNAGSIYEYDANGNDVGTFQVGIIPGGFYFQ